MKISGSFILFVLLLICPNVRHISSAAAEVPFTTQQGEKLWEDIRIGVIVKKVVKAAVLPEETTKELQLSPSDIIKPAEGHDIVCIQLNIGKITNVHLVSLGGRNVKNSAITDAAGHKYELESMKATGIKFLDNSLSSPYEYIEGSDCILQFEIPKDIEPTGLTFVYYFKESMDDESSKKGQIDIKIKTKENLADDNIVNITGTLVKEDGSPFANAGLMVVMFKDGRSSIKVGNGGIVLNPSAQVSEEDKGRFKLELNLENFKDTEEFAIDVHFGYPKKQDLLRNSKGAILTLKKTELIKNLDLGKIIVK